MIAIAVLLVIRTPSLIGVPERMLARKKVSGLFFAVLVAGGVPRQECGRAFLREQRVLTPFSHEGGIPCRVSRALADVSGQYGCCLGE